MRDVTGDGRDEILILGGDSVECRDGAAVPALECSKGIRNLRSLDLRDYAGDGSRGILSTTTRRPGRGLHGGRPYGRSIPLWMDENNFGGHTRFGKLLPGVAGAQVASTSSGQTPPAPTAAASGWSASRTASIDPTSGIRQALPGDFYSPLMLFDDLDGDGAVEMAVISHEAALVLRHGDRPSEVHGALLRR